MKRILALAIVALVLCSTAALAEAPKGKGWQPATATTVVGTQTTQTPTPNSVKVNLQKLPNGTWVTVPTTFYGIPYSALDWKPAFPGLIQE